MSGATEPNPAIVFGAIQGYMQTAAIQAAIRLDLFTAIGEGATDEAALAARTGAAPRGIRALCDWLTVRGLLTKDGSGAYGLSPTAAAFLDRRSPGYMGSIEEFLAAPELVGSVLEDPAGVVRRGGAPGLGSIAPDNPVWVKFARAMTPFAAPVAAATLAWFERHSGRAAPRRVLDVAAGHGLFGLAFAQRYPECEVTALDWAAVLEVAKENAARAGVSGRFRTIAGSAFEADLGGPYDVVLMPNFLHHFDEAGCVALLRRAHAALVLQGGLLLAPEFVPEEDRVSPPMPAMFAFVMLLSTPAGTAYTRGEYARILAAAGFARAEFAPLPPSPQTLVVGVR